MSKSQFIANADLDDLVNKLPLNEVINLTAGVGFWWTHAVPSANIPSIKFSDGPNGIRGQRFFRSTPAKALPCATGLGSTWDLELIGKAAAKLLADEAKLRGASVILAPTVNIQRSPLGGRSFESYSEDPFLSGHIASAYISNVQERGIGTCIKHFVANDMENDRMAYDSIISPRALREIYLMPFMIAQKYAKPWSYMTAYNRVNGTHMTEHSSLIQNVLRGEWNSDALVMSDWFAVYSVTEAINAGLDLEMPGDKKFRQYELVDRAVTAKKTTPRILRERAKKVLELVQKCAKGAPEVIDGDGEERTLDSAEDVKMMRDLASASIVLLKNEGSILPLDASSMQTIAVIGPNAKARLVSGGGSASLKASYFVTPYDGIVNAITEGRSNATVKYHEGCQASLTLPTLEDYIITEDGKPGFTGSWYCHTDDNLTVAPEPHATYDIDEMTMFIQNGAPEGLTERWSLRLKGYIKPVTQDTQFQFGVTVNGRAKLYIDGELVVDNWTKQVRGVAFFGSGTVEERGVVELKAGKKHEIYVDFCNVRGPAGDHTDNMVYVGGSAVRIGGAQILDQEKAIAESCALAKQADVAVVVVGLNGDWETEGYDRTSLKLPGATNELVTRVLQANPRTVIVTQCGSAVEMPWVDKAPAIVHAWYLGNATGDAIADVLFGKVNPSGKMSMTFPKRLEDTPSYGHFASQNGKVRYAEDLFVGYKHYQHAKIEPLFAFGHGLSYTTFEYSDLVLTTSRPSSNAEDFSVTVSLNVTNTGKLAGSEIVQVYVSLPPTQWSHVHPLSQLKGFTKAKDIKPGEKRAIKIVLDKYAVSYWEESIERWRAEVGEYHIQVGKSSDNIALSDKFALEKVLEWNGL